ncbi:(5-formylfuran-3-yl)methyl phosphate synthase [Salinarimonas soli]|uniref:(5-formylfuran-3-yl)methyl phosphate synthase n=1 Tax=Salinarimonas soli TaxID=1638099 RepID=A0A5B2VDC8_9HYPH|nr:(5-formylfuran-3-yl)methyl phosphate synthase [Salinarimonas soli]KAA2237513.1 hypothetical protein F0L46_11025 [Salinarimonas soli]
MPHAIGFSLDQPAPRLLVSVRDTREAVEAAGAGADLVDAKDPDEGALGSLAPDTVRAITLAVGGRACVSAVAGEAAGLGDLVTRIRVTAACGVGMVKVALSPALAADPDLERLAGALGALGTPTVAVLFAEDGPRTEWLPNLALAGFAGAMIDTRGKAGLRLTDHLTLSALTDFVMACRRLGLLSGLAGSLTLDDIPRLSGCGPSYLGFRGGLSVGSDRRGRLDPARVSEARRRLAPVAA